MGTVADMRRRFEMASMQIDDIVRQIFDSSTALFVELVQDNLREGRDGNNATLKPYASDAYAQLKQNLGSQAPFGIPDLLLTGGFYNGMTVIWLSRDSFSIISNDVKWRKLMAMYGLDTLKLSPQAIQYFIVNRLNPRFIREISFLTGANFS